MAQAKTSVFDLDLIRTARWAKALAHPVRIRILEILAGRGTCVCGCLVDLLPLAQSTVSQHLGELRDAGLIRGEIDGPRTCYCLDPGIVAGAGADLAGLFRRLCGTPGDGPAGFPSASCRPGPVERPVRPRHPGGGRRRTKPKTTRKGKKERS
jgi:ArsR family transcriptional regulator